MELRSDPMLISQSGSQPLHCACIHPPPGPWLTARALIGGGGVYSYIHVMPDGFLLKSVVFKFISKEISRAEHEYTGCIK